MSSTDLRDHSLFSTAKPWRFLFLCATGSLVLGCGQSEADDTLGVVGAVALPAHRADFDHDGTEDLVVHGDRFGDTELWHVQPGSPGNQLVNAVELFSSQLDLPASSGWKGVGISDFDLDGNPDILWHNGTTGETQLWFMDHANRLGFRMLTNPDFSNEVSRPDSSGWQIAGTGDFNNDGIPDILWHNGVTGETDIWHMTIHKRPLRFQRIDAGAVQPSWSVPDSSGWRVAGINDFNHDGKLDIVWNHLATGQLAFWFLNDATFVDSAVSGDTLPGGGRSEVLAVDDQNHDGNPDILWRDVQEGWVQGWLMNGVQRASDFIIFIGGQGPFDQVNLDASTHVLNR